MLHCKNIIVNGRRTSMRLDKVTWQSLSDICKREDTTLRNLCSKIDDAKGAAGLSSTTRLVVLMYYRRLLEKYELQLPNENRVVKGRVDLILSLIKGQ